LGDNTIGKTVSIKSKQVIEPTLPADGNRHVAPKSGPMVSLERVLVPLDFSGRSRQALQVAVPLAQRYGGQVWLMHVVEPGGSYPYFVGEATLATFDTTGIIERARERLATMANRLVPRELLGKNLVRVGRAYIEIITGAEELNADLIVIATHGYTGLKHMVLGSTAEQVVRHANCPVLTVRIN